ncbi:hypothetical protein F5882DRAFT_474997 [Hyaloscypha sp. PMI_1271]|nr:hypothetical protein F5882DRAFT_474997 [Hyaloscypha sp. PMI_1271]
MPFHSDVAPVQEVPNPRLTSAPPGQNILVPPSPTCNIPLDDWNHARALVTKYPPEIVLWIIRGVSCEPRVAPSFSGSGSLSSISSAHMVASSTGTIQTSPSMLVSPSCSTSSLCQNLGGVSTPFHETGGSVNVLISPYPEEKEHAMEPRNVASPEVTPVSKQSESRWFCVFNEHKEKSFGRRSDWRKHMKDFHKPDKKVWECPDCHQYFDQLGNFTQHHSVQHCHLNRCKHSGSATKLRCSKRAFACGRQRCDCLLHSWDEWRDHVAEHLEDRMPREEWQHNTLFRNLLRREEIHLRWQKFDCDKVGNYNVAARFNWHARNTMDLKQKLEYCETILESDSERLVEDAYRRGLEVRTADEASNPSTLITEPCTTRSQADVPSYDPSSQLLQGVANFDPRFERSEKEFLEDPNTSHSQLVADSGSGMTGNDGSFDCTDPMQLEMFSDNWGNWGYDDALYGDGMDTT